MNKYLKLALCILTPLLIGAVADIATATSIDGWFVELNKPIFNPPNYLFGPVWTFLYILMGISLFLIMQTPKVYARRRAIVIFVIQLFLNFCWSFLFFKFHLLCLAFIEIIVIWLSIITMIYAFKKINKTAAYLQIPYLLWVSFASVLNGTICYLN
ncbi:MAG: tryptophan-rich sensory protein [Bacteroidetes bacterium]|nr:tryptophan-rich sensory protein [Bacteroidota bacterium]